MSDEEAQAVRAARLAYLRKHSARRTASHQSLQLVSASFDEGRPPLNEWLRSTPPHLASLILEWAATRPDLVDVPGGIVPDPTDNDGPQTFEL